MEYLWEHNSDHALLAATIREAHSVVGSERKIGRITVQKLMYILKTLKLPMNYRFEIYHYGPFCSQIARDIETLQLDGIIVDDSNGEPGSNYRPTDRTEDMIKYFGQGLASEMEKIRIAAKVFAPMSPKDLELFATLDFIYRETLAREADKDIRAIVTERFMDLKKTRFSKFEVDKLYDELLRLGVYRAA